MKPENKIKFNNDYAKVSSWINEFDPMGLISFGAPADEYDSLTNQILSFVYAHKSKDEIRELTLHQLESYFGWAEVRGQNEPYKTIFNNDLDKFLDKLNDKEFLS